MRLLRKFLIPLVAFSSLSSAQFMCPYNCGSQANPEARKAETHLKKLLNNECLKYYLLDVLFPEWCVGFVSDSHMKKYVYCHLNPGSVSCGRSTTVSFREFNLNPPNRVGVEGSSRINYKFTLDGIEGYFEVFCMIEKFIKNVCYAHEKNFGDCANYSSNVLTKKYLSDSTMSDSSKKFWIQKHQKLFLEYSEDLKKQKERGQKNLVRSAECQKKIEGIYKDIYHDCLVNHGWIGALSKLGLIEYMNGNVHDTLDYIDQFLEKVKSEKIDPEVLANMHLTKGQTLSEVGLYNDAIVSLTEAVKTNPKNKEAYVERARNYFETGDFELAFEDFLTSGTSTTPLEESNKEIWEFALGFSTGATIGAFDAGIEFLPGILASLRGLSAALYELGAHPKDFSLEVINSARELYDFLQSSDTLEILSAFIPELKTLLDEKETLTEHEKGKLMGRIVGRYGADFLFLACSAKAIRLCREFKYATTVCAIERAAASIEKEQTLIKAWEAKKAFANSIKEQGHQAGKELYKALRNEVLTENEIRILLHEAGFKTFPRPKGIPKNWVVNITEKNGGMVYRHPQKSGCSVRVMPGNLKNAFSSQKESYIVHVIEGSYVDKFGRKVSKKSAEAHIPFSEFKFKSEILK